MNNQKLLEGNEVTTLAVKLCEVEMVAAYPITPSSSIVEKISELCAKGDIDCQFIHVESEHSAMASLIGAAMTGVRVFTATSSQGLALMHEMLHWAAGARLPIVIVNVNRALAPPWTIFCDHTDSLSQRDTGWMQVYCENNQEILDTIIQSYRISEQVGLPTMVNIDAFALSHTSEAVEVPKPETVREFLPLREAAFKLDIEDPHTFGSGTNPQFYMGIKYRHHLAMQKARTVIKSVNAEFVQTFNRQPDRQNGRPDAMIDTLKTEDAEVILVTAGSMSSNAKLAIMELRQKGVKVGLMRIRYFRPFPLEEVTRTLAKASKVAVVDRNCSYGMGGIFCNEVKSALLGQESSPQVFGYVAGIGGMDTGVGMFKEVVKKTMEKANPEPEPEWIGVNL